MADPFVESLMAWKPFRFFVGPDKKEFTMHADLVANMSKSLNALVNGAMKEAREGEAYLPEVDEATFALFFRYAYKGDYEVAGLKLLDPTVCRTEICLSCKEDLIQCSCHYCNSCACLSCDCDVKDTQISFNHNLHGYVSCDEEVKTLQEFAGGASLTFQMFDFRTYNTNAVFLDVLLAHARLYVMADYYDIRPLAMISKTKIHQVLALLGLRFKDQNNENSSINVVCNLFDYVCSNTVDQEESPDLLRALLYNYCAMNIRFLSREDRFLRLLREKGDFSTAIICEIAKRKVCCSHDLL